MVLATLTPLASVASASGEIHLTLDSTHVVLDPGQSSNVTLDITNNESSIYDYLISIDNSTSSQVWEVIPSPSFVEDIFPTWSKNATIVIRLATGATPSDNSQVDIVVTKNGTNVSSTITLYLSVNPVYSPRVESRVIGDNGLLQIRPGQTVDVDVPVYNDGSVTDTILLDVGNEPDIASFWANWTTGGGNNSNGNSSDNGTNGGGDDGNQTNNTGGNDDNQTGGDGAGNGTGNGTQTGGNQTGNSSNSTQLLSSVLMFGNSYTQQNSLDSLLQSILNSAGGNVSVSALTGGGMRLPQHYTNVNTSGNQWNTTLSNSGWDYVVLQDQSQVPSFPRNNTYWIDSKDAAILLADRIDDEGSEVVLLMTWGRRSGDAQNPARNPNFPTMQGNLESGYADFQSNMTANTNATVWMAPVGLAWEAVYDDVIANNGTPTLPGNTFYDLYTSDGSHPSLSGSYLSACVLYATLTGQTPVGVNDSTNLNSSLKLELQKYAADTVFNNTQNIAYPWQSSQNSSGNMSTSSFSLMSSHSNQLPQNWQVRWLDDTVENLGSGLSETRTLRISIPNGTSPGYTGVRLYAGSTSGNFSTSSLFVIEVTAEMSLSFSFDNQNSTFAPGQTVSTFLTIENTGTAESSYDWTVTSQSSDCAITTSEDMTVLGISQPYMLPIDVTVNPNMNRNDVCSFSITGTASNNSDISFSGAFDIFVDELVNYTISGPDSATLTPGEGLVWDVVFTNLGTESVDAYLAFSELNEVLTTLSGNRVQSVAEGQTVTWTVTSIASSGSFGSGYVQSFWVSHSSGFNASFDVDFTIAEEGGLMITGPSDNRVTLPVSGSSNLSINLENTGTKNLTLTPTISGLASGIDANIVSEIELVRGSDNTTIISFTASNTAQVGSNTVTISFTDGSDSWNYEFDIQVTNSHQVSVSSISNSLVAGSIREESLTLSVTNLGTSTDTYTISIDATEASEYFEFSLSTTSLTVDSKQSADLTFSARRTGQNVPSGLIANITVTSVSDSTSSDVFGVSVLNASLGVDLSISLNDREVEPGAELTGSVVVTNTGNAEDTISVTVQDTGCDLNQAVTLMAGQSSSALAFTCQIPDNSLAGLTGFTIRSSSALDSSFYSEVSESFTVLTSYPETGFGRILVSQDMFEIGSDSDATILVTVENNANTQIIGNLDLVGEGADLFIVTWTSKLNGQETSQFSIPAQSSVQFDLMLVPARSVTFDEMASITVVSTITLEASTESLESEPIDYLVVGLNREPSGVTLPFGITLDNAQSITAASSGWIVSILLFLVVRMLMKSRSRMKLEAKIQTKYEESEEEVEEESDLGEGETRLIDSTRVECPSCSSILGVPAGSQAPFRFNCPSCSNMIKVVE